MLGAQQVKFIVLLLQILHTSSSTEPQETMKSSMSIVFFPAGRATVAMGHTTPVQFNLTCSQNTSCDWDSSYEVTFQSMDTRVVRVDYPMQIYHNSTGDFHGNSNDTLSNMSLTLRGVIIGKTRILLQVHDLNRRGTDRLIHTDYLTVAVTRGNDDSMTLFVYLLTPVIILTTASFGCKLDLDVLKKFFRRPVGILIGFICQYGIMPTLAYTAAKVARLPNSYAFGLLSMGCSPGGGFSNVWTFLLGGDLDLSIAMTFCSTVAALGMMPLWLYTVGRQFLSDGIGIPYENICISLISLVAPLVVGVLVKRYLPKVAGFALKVIQPLLLLFFLVMLPVGIYANSYVFAMIPVAGWPLTVAALSLPVLGYSLGGFLAFITRRPWKHVKTIAIETGIQNTGIAMVILRLGYPEPESDMASLSAVEATMFTPVPLFVAFVVRIIYLTCTQNTEERSKMVRSIPCCIAYRKIQMLRQKIQERRSGGVLVDKESSPKSEDVPESSQECKPENGIDNDVFCVDTINSDANGSIGNNRISGVTIVNGNRLETYL